MEIISKSCYEFLKLIGLAGESWTKIGCRQWRGCSTNPIARGIRVQSEAWTAASQPTPYKSRFRRRNHKQALSVSLRSKDFHPSLQLFYSTFQCLFCMQEDSGWFSRCTWAWQWGIVKRSLPYFIIVPRTLDISPLFYLLFPNVLSRTLFGMSFWLPEIKHSQTWNILIELGKQKRFFFMNRQRII